MTCRGLLRLLQLTQLDITGNTSPKQIESKLMIWIKNCILFSYQGYKKNYWLTKSISQTLLEIHTEQDTFQNIPGLSFHTTQRSTP